MIYDTPPQPIVPRTPDRLPSAVLRGSLEHGLIVCLGLLGRESERFEPAALAWHARWYAPLPDVTFAEAHATLAALEALGGPDCSVQARELSDAFRRHQLDEAATVLDEWLADPARRDAAARPRRQPSESTAA